MLHAYCKLGCCVARQVAAEEQLADTADAVVAELQKMRQWRHKTCCTAHAMNSVH
jgi:hypothetical protein